MSELLYIAEKELLAETIAAELGNPQNKTGYIQTDKGKVTWCFGHMYENLEPNEYDEKYSKWALSDLPIIPDEFKLKLKERCSYQVAIINKLIESSDQLINCGDPDREGQLLVDEVIENANFNGVVKRAWLKDLSKTGLAKTLANLEENTKYKSMSDSAKARSHLDWLTGLNLTRVYTLLGQSRGMRSVLSVGRVQTPTLKLVVDRDLEIENFKSVEFYEIKGSFEFGGIKFECKKDIDTKHKGKNKRCTDKDFITNEIKRLNSIKEFTVISCESKERQKNAPLPFSLSDLQTFCSKKLGLSAQEVLDVAQSLYSTHKITSYPRSDCNYLSEGDFKDSVKTLKSIGTKYLDLLKTDEMPKCFNDKKVTAHTAIIPNGNQSSNLSDNEKNVYEIICKRFIAQFASPYKYSETVIVLEKKSDTFKTKGKIDIDLGFRRILKSNEPKKPSESQKLPTMKKDDQVNHLESSLNIKKTTAPKKYTEGTLITAMSNISKSISNDDEREILADVGGIGTEATRAGIIETLKQREYLVLDKKNITSTPKARNFISLMIDEIKSPILTAQWEISLSEIESKTISYDEFILEQKQWIKKICELAKKTDCSKFGGKPCPKCGEGFQTLKQGPKVKFIGCTLYPKCDFTVFPKVNSKAKKTKRKSTRRIK